MGECTLSNDNIVKCCEKAGKFLASSGVERREALRIKFTFEEILLKYQEKFGEEASFNVRFVKRLSTMKIEIIVGGDSYDPLNDNSGEDTEVINNLLTSIGLAPTWAYKSGKNYIVFMPAKKPMTATVKMVVAVVLAFILGSILSFMPDGIKEGANNYLLTPITNAFMGLITAVSGPLIFLSVLGSICSMGNVKTLGKIGGKTIKIILIYTTAIAASITAFICLFYPVKTGGGGASNFSQIFDLIYGIIPSNLFEPFISGNTLQLIFISVIVGLAMLVLSSRVRIIFQLVEQFSSIVQTIMSGLTSMLPFLVFVLFTGMISGGSLGTILKSWKVVVVIVLSAVAYYVVNLLRISIMKKVSPIVLLKKAWPTLMICLSTASSAAAFTTNVRDAHKKLGIEKKLVDFGIPFGQVLFMPGFIAILIGMATGFAESSGIEITLPWIIIGCITSLLVSFAIPPVPGGAMMGFTVVFAQMGISPEVMGIALAINAITDFPCTACNVSGWQLTMIDVADSLKMLDKETLRKNI